ncbi:hypothetical protein Gotur_001400 [Gossypium turneri]
MRVFQNKDWGILINTFNPLQFFCLLTF